MTAEHYERTHAVIESKAWAVVGALVLVVGLYWVSLYSYLLFHFLIEMFSVAVALCIFFIAWNSSSYTKNGYLTFVGIAYLFVGFFDLLHTLAYKGSGIFPGESANLPTQLWISARYIESLSLLGAMFFFDRRPNPTIQIIGYTAASGALLVSIFYFNLFPTCYVDGSGLTHFKIMSEYIVCGTLAVVLALLARARSRFEPRVFALLVGAVSVTIVTEMVFTLYVSVYGFANQLGHYLKLLSFYLVYKALIETGFREPYALLFRELSLKRSKLELEISRREQLEQALRSSEERYRIVADFAYDWEFWIDPDGNFVYVSPSCERITGHTFQEFLSNPGLFVEIVVEEDKPLVEEHMRAVLSGEHAEPITFDFRICHTNGEIRWINHSCQTVTGSDGSNRGRRASNRDITQVKRAMDIVRQADRHRAVADLAGGIAHNFNNLLQIVISGIENSISDMEEGDLKKAKDSLELILDSCDRGADTVRKLLHFASTRSDSQNDGFTVLDLSELVMHALEVCRPIWGDESARDGNRIRVNTDFQTDVFVKGRFDQLADVVISIIRNAVEAIEAHGSVDVSVSRDMNEGVIIVRDTGVGMSPEDQNRIFTPFFTTKVSAGSGLALATALKIVNNHGGKILVDSVLGHGATFRIRIPLSQQCPQPEFDEVYHEVSRGMTILVIDDAKVVTDMLAAALTKEGYVVSTATSGAQALEKFRDESFDAIVCDLGMPDMNGLELSRKIKAICDHRGAPKPPVIIITGWEQKLTPDFVQAGVDEILTKPVKVGMLLASLEKSFTYN